MLRLLIVLLVLVVIVALPFFLIGDELAQSLSGEGATHWLKESGPYAWLTAIGLLIADLLLPVPTTAVIAALGIVYGPVLGGLVATVGSVSSGLIGYGVCRRFGRPVARWFVGDKALGDGERYFARAGGWMVVLSRWLPVLSEVIACIAGLARMPFPIFLVALLCGSIPLSFVFSVIGHAGEDRPLLTLGLSALLPVLLWLVLQPLFRRGAAKV